jgi:protein phosphatase
MKLQVGQLSQIGTQHTHNQDGLGASQGVPAELLAARGQLFVVADGFGKEAAGQAASAAAVAALTRTYYASPEHDTGTALVKAVLAANEAVAGAVAAVGGAGATLTAAVLRSRSLHVAHVGDSRAYLLRGGRLRQLTHDHTRGADQLRSGKATAEQVAQDPKRGQLTRALGQAGELKREDVEHIAEAVQSGDALLLCTDGLSDAVKAEELRDALVGRDPQAACQQLVELARPRRGDDVTVIVVGAGGLSANIWAPLAAVGGALFLIVLAAAVFSSSRPASSPPPPLATTVAPPAGAQPIPPPAGAQPVPLPPGVNPTSTLAPTRPAVAPVQPTTSGGAGTPQPPAGPLTFAAPQFTAPGDNAEYRGPNADVRLRWNAVPGLGPDDSYVVISDFPHDGAVWRDWQVTKNTEVVMPRYLYDMLTGDRRVRWRVAVWRNAEIKDGKLTGTQVGAESAGWGYVWWGEIEGTPTPKYEG